MSIEEYQVKLINYLKKTDPDKLKFNPQVIDIKEDYIIFGMNKHIGRLTIKKTKCFEFTNLTNEEGKPYGGDISFSVEYTDKRFKDRKDWKVDYWDNVNWFNGLIKGNPDSLPELEATVDKEDAKLFIEALQYLKELEWF
jgi:hypothetical protein